MARAGCSSQEVALLANQNIVVRAVSNSSGAGSGGGTAFCRDVTPEKLAMLHYRALCPCTHQTWWVYKRDLAIRRKSWWRRREELKESEWKP